MTAPERDEYTPLEKRQGDITLMTPSRAHVRRAVVPAHELSVNGSPFLYRRSLDHPTFNPYDTLSKYTSEWKILQHRYSDN